MKKILLMVAALAVFSLSVKANGSKVYVMHNGHIIQISIDALPAHLALGDVVMVFYNGQWMTLAQYQALTSGQGSGGGLQ